MENFMGYTSENINIDKEIEKELELEEAGFDEIDMYRSLKNRYKTLYDCYKKIDRVNEKGENIIDWVVTDDIEVAKTYDEYCVATIDHVSEFTSLSGKIFNGINGIIRTKEFLYYWKPDVQFTESWKDYCDLGEYCKVNVTIE